MSERHIESSYSMKQIDTHEHNTQSCHKTLLVLFLISVMGSLATTAKGQNYFPLQVGNEWHYRWNGYDWTPPFRFDSGVEIMRASRDTIMPNQKSYTDLTRYYGVRYLRNDSSVTYGYYPESDTEFLLYKWNANVGDHWDVVQPITRVDLESISIDTVFGQALRTVQFRHMNDIVGPVHVRFAENIGPVFMHYEGEPPGSYQTEHKLSGCKIDRKESGELLSTTPPAIAVEMALMQNYPNPVSWGSETAFPFSLAASTTIELVLLDLLGREIMSLARGTYTAGKHSVTYRTKSLSRGVYFYQLRIASHRLTRTMLVF